MSSSSAPPVAHALPGGDERLADRPDELTARARDGDMRAWSQLYQKHFERVFRRLCAFVGQATIAEDLTQETFARAVVALPSYDGRGAFGAWLGGIAINVARNHLRAQDNQRRAEQSLAHVASLRLERDDVGRTHLQRARTEALYAALSTLSDLQREAFILREIEGLSMHDAAIQAGVSTNAMTVRVWRAREAIRHELTRLGWLGGEE